MKWLFLLDGAQDWERTGINIDWSSEEAEAREKE